MTKNPVPVFAAPGGPPVESTFDTAGTYTFLCEIHSEMTGSVTVEDAPPPDALERVLVFSKTEGFRHDSIPAGIAAIEEMGTNNDFAVDATEDATAFTDANLAQYDAVIFLSTTGDVLNQAQQDAFERYIQAGHGYVGIHAAADTEYEWQWYGQMLGGYFLTHPPGTAEAAIDIEDLDEPSTQGVPPRWTRTDEWYNYRAPTSDTSGPDYSPRDAGVHVLATLDESTYDEQDGNTTDDDHPIAWCTDFDGGRAWYTGLGHTIESFSEPNFRSHLLGGIRTAAGAAEADCGEAREAPPGPEDFEKVTLDDDTSNPMELDVAADGRVFYIERTGEVRIWKPSNEQTVEAGVIPVTTSQENGLLGLQLAPDFEQSGWLYLFYSQLPDSSNTQVVSRFKVVGDELDMTSEQRILTYQHQREECCHSSGSLYFGLDGSLYITSGDNTNPFASDGYTPIDERPGRAFWDAQRTAANTDDLNGKLLRIMPMATPTGPPGVGSTYTIPEGNLFAPGTANTRPEIYGMGFRNPFRFTIDPKTGWVLLGDYGPDAGQTNPNRGPQGSVEFNAVTSPGNYGWPYCVRQNAAYNDYNFATNTSGPKFNCAAPTNNSPNNTGLAQLPPARPATMWMGYTETDARFPELGGGGAPTGGPRYDYDPANPTPTKFPEYYDGEWFIGEWNEGWIKTATLNAQGNATDVSPFALGEGYKRPMDMDFGPDGSLYVIEWGSGFGGNNLDSGIYRIDYVKGARRPIARATATPDSGPAPLAVEFSSEGSVDPDGTSLTYAWDFDNDGTVDSSEPNPTHTYTTPGTYTANLRVTDQADQTGVDNVQVIVGNTEPQVTIEIPEDGQLAAFGDKVPYRISVTDAEDGSTDAGTIPCSEVTLNVSLGHDQHAHELSEHTGCEGTFDTLAGGGHGPDSNIFTVIEATYTDEGGAGGVTAITGRDQAILQPKRKQAEHFDSTGRAPGATAGGDPGVQPETASDPEGGGQSIAFIENGDYVSYRPFNLEEIDSLRFRVSSGSTGGTIEVRLDGPAGELVGTAEVTPTGGWQNYEYVEMALPTPPQGTHELFLVFRHPTEQAGLMNVNWIDFHGKGAAVSAAPDVSADADPKQGVAPLEVAFDGTATDPEGEALTYEWDFGVSGTSDDTSTEIDPTYTYEEAGTYTATFTATDPHGQDSSATVQIRATGDECPTGPTRSDEFDGDALDRDRWTVLRDDDTYSVANGQLELPIANGSMYQAGATARNIIVQPAPTGEWQATAKITAELTENYHQAGLRVYSDDDQWASVHMIHAGGQRDIEFIYETGGQPRNEAADKLGGIPEDSPTTYYVRVTSDGSELTASYSFDGSTFLPVGRPAPVSTFTDPQIGPTALSDQAPTVPTAFFDWIRFTPDTTGGADAPAGEYRDDFDGSDVGAGWEVVRRDQEMSVSGSALRIPAAQGDLYADNNTAKNLVVREAPAGEWVATSKLSFNGAEPYHQAGIIVYGDDQNYAKLGRIAHSGADEKFEFIHEAAGSPRNEAADSTANLPAGFPDDFYVRLASDGTNLTASYSTNGTAWTPVGRPAPLAANPKIGMFAFGGAAPTSPEAAFDWFTLSGDGVGGPGGPSRDDHFDGTTLDKERWNAIVRENPDTYAVSGGELTITTEPGDIYTADSNPPPNNFILQSADHAGENWTIETKLSGTIDGGYGQGGLIAYEDGGNYVKFDAISDAGNTRINRLELRSEVGDAIADPTADAEVPEGTTDIWLRITKTGTSYAGEYSFDGTTFTAMTAAVQNAMAAPDFGVYAFGPQADGQGDTVSFDYFLLDGEDQGGPCECEGSGDGFDGTTLDKTRWNEIVREDDTKYAVKDGGLEVTTVGGDIYAESDPAATRNFFLQSADHAGADYVLETKLSGTIDGGYAQGGILVYEDDANYVKFDAISDEGNTRINRIELRSEEANAVEEPQPSMDVPVGTTDIWLRLTKAGTLYSGEVSFDGETFTAMPGAVDFSKLQPRFGLFTLGVNKPGGTVTFDYFAVDGETGCPDPPPTNQSPVIDSAGADPSSGFAPLAVEFTVNASDPDGDDLTYSWDFDGDGTEDSTEQNPSHTYGAPGEYDAEVTVDDGNEGTARRTVTVSVLAEDDDQARFRVLVFSKTTGFRHDSIDEGHAAIEALGEANDFQVDHTEDATLFRDDVLEHFDTVVFLSTTGDPLDSAQQAAFRRYIEGGGGYTGIHAAADTEYEWRWYGRLVGAYFQSHPPGTPTASVDVEDPDHHSTQGLPARWTRTDEWYNYRSPDSDPGGADYSPRAKVHVLATVDESTYDEQDGSTTDDDHPISWCRRAFGGRSWYTGMGHTAESFAEEDFQRHLLGGIEVTAGAVPDADCGVKPNRPPRVRALADPRRGDAPLPVEFSARASDPEGGEVAYDWNFGDGGRSVRQNPDHVYRTPGDYTAKVTVTDRQGATTTAEITIRVSDPPGNVTPTVEAAADPASGAAPLEVRLSALGSDPDGDELGYAWDLGDGTRAFGAQATHTYVLPGTYTATVRATDPGGASATASVTITVGSTAGALDAGGVPGTSAESVVISVDRRQAARRVLRRGLRFRARCALGCELRAELQLRGRNARRIGRRGGVRSRAVNRSSTRRFDSARTRRVAVRPRGARGRKLLRAMRRQDAERLRMTLVVRVTTPTGPQTVRRSIVLRD